MESRQENLSRLESRPAFLTGVVRPNGKPMHREEGRLAAQIA